MAKTKLNTLGWERLSPCFVLPTMAGQVCKKLPFRNYGFKFGVARICL